MKIGDVASTSERMSKAFAFSPASAHERSNIQNVGFLLRRHAASDGVGRGGGESELASRFLMMRSSPGQNGGVGWDCRPLGRIAGVCSIFHQCFCSKRVPILGAQKDEQVNRCITTASIALFEFSIATNPFFFFFLFKKKNGK